MDASSNEKPTLTIMAKEDDPIEKEVTIQVNTPTP